MAIAASEIPKLYSQRVLERLYFNPNWLMTVDDRSGELTTGDRLYIPDYTTTISVVDYTKDTALGSAGLMSLTQITLDIDQDKATQVYVDDKDLRQAPGSAITEAAEQAFQVMETGINTFLRTTRDGVQGTGATQVGHLAQVNCFRSNSSNAATAVKGKFGDALFRKQLMSTFITASTKARVDAWPEMGRYVVMHPDIYEQMVRYVTEDVPNLGGGGIVDLAFTQGTLPRVHGWDVIFDKDISGSHTTAANSAYVMYFGLRGRGLTYAQQMAMPEMIRDQSRFGYVLRQRYVYGGCVTKNDFVMWVNFDIDT